MDRAGIGRVCLALPATELTHSFGDDHDGHPLFGYLELHADAAKLLGRKGNLHRAGRQPSGGMDDLFRQTVRRRGESRVLPQADMLEPGLALMRAQFRGGVAGCIQADRVRPRLRSPVEMRREAFLNGWRGNRSSDRRRGGVGSVRRRIERVLCRTGRGRECRSGRSRVAVRRVLVTAGRRWKHHPGPCPIHRVAGCGRGRFTFLCGMPGGPRGRVAAIGCGVPAVCLGRR